MSWINDRINFCKGQSHTAIPAVTTADCHPNATHHADLEQEKTALAETQVADCQRLIKELWLSECETSINQQDKDFRAAKALSDQIVSATTLPVRRSWHNAA